MVPERKHSIKHTKGENKQEIPSAEYDRFSVALKKVLQVSHAELNDRIKAAKASKSKT